MARPFRFLDLPGELRNAIYNAYSEDMTIEIHNNGGLYPALARTSRQVRQELVSTLHIRRLPFANLSVRVVDFDFTALENYLRFLCYRDHNSDDHVRHITVYLDIMTPAATYGPERAKWCTNPLRNVDLDWYNEDLQRVTDLVSDRRLPLRIRGNRDIYNVTFVARFPPSLIFSVKQRQHNVDWYHRFRRQFVAPYGTRALMMNDHIERAIIAFRAREWVDKYWEAHRNWNEYLVDCIRRGWPQHEELTKMEQQQKEASEARTETSIAEERVAMVLGYGKEVGE